MKKNPPSRHAWVKTGVRNIYSRAGKFYFVKMVDGRRCFTVLTDPQGKPVGELASAINAAGKIAENPFVGKTEDSKALLEEFFMAKLGSRDWEATTQNGHKHVYDSFLADLGKPILAATARDLQAWYDAQRTRGITDSSALTYFACIASLYRWLFAERKIAHNPALDVAVKTPEPAEERRFASYTERDQAIAGAKGNDSLMVFLFLGFHFGLRRREIDHARPEWIDLQSRTLRVRNLLNPPQGLRYFRIKNGKERTIPISKDATSFFRRYLKSFPQDGKYLLHPEKAEQGKNRYRYDMRKPFELHMKGEGLEWMTIQGMRTTFASLLATTGEVSIQQIADWLGDTIKVTEERYAHLMPRHDLLEKAFRDRKDHSGKGSSLRRATAARRSSIA